MSLPPLSETQVRSARAVYAVAIGERMRLESANLQLLRTAAEGRTRTGGPEMDAIIELVDYLEQNNLIGQLVTSAELSDQFPIELKEACVEVSRLIQPLHVD